MNFASNLVSVVEIGGILLRSKWAAGKARGGSISESIRDRRATQPPAHFHRNPLGRASWLFFRVARSTRMTQIWALRSRLEKQPTDLRQNTSYFGDRTLESRDRYPSRAGSLYKVTSVIWHAIIAVRQS